MQKSTSKAAGEDGCLMEDNSDDDLIAAALSSNVENMCFHRRRPLAGWNQFQVSVMLEIDRQGRVNDSGWCHFRKRKTSRGEHHAHWRLGTVRDL